MRVLLNTVPYYGKGAGARTYTAELLGALQASDVDMEWQVILHPADLERLGLCGDARFHSLWPSRLMGLSAVPGVRFVWRNATEQLLLAPSSARCDLVHYLDSYGPLLVPRAVPVVLTVHDLIPLGRTRYFAWWTQAYLAALMRRTIPRADALLAVSGHTATRLTTTLGIPAERIVVAPNGIAARFGPQSASERRRVAEAYTLPHPYVICVGSIHPRKNVARLIRAFARARHEQALPHQLVLVGALSWQFDDVLEAIRTANVGATGAAGAAETVVRHLGRVPDADLAPLIAGADCLAYLSLDEGFGLPVVEAMACGTPVLTSAGAALAEVAADAALLVEPRSEDEIVHGLARLLTDSARRVALREAGFARAARFGWAEVGRAVVGVYRDVYVDMHADVRARATTRSAGDASREAPQVAHRVEREW
jgi:glycosyltransferase involved in cell wall biosynthesis